jgi:hypothetical protein
VVTVDTTRRGRLRTASHRAETATLFASGGALVVSEGSVHRSRWLFRCTDTRWSLAYLPPLLHKAPLWRVLLQHCAQTAVR